MQQFRKYESLNFLHVWLENAYSRPQNRRLGEFDPLSGSHYKQNQKDTSFRESASFEPSSTKICRPVWPVGEFPKRILLYNSTIWRCKAGKGVQDNTSRDCPRRWLVSRCQFISSSVQYFRLTDNMTVVSDDTRSLDRTLFLTLRTYMSICNIFYYFNALPTGIDISYTCTLFRNNSHIFFANLLFILCRKFFYSFNPCILIFFTQ